MHHAFAFLPCLYCARNAAHRHFHSSFVIPIGPFNDQVTTPTFLELTDNVKINSSFTGSLITRCHISKENKANLRDLITATGLVILLKLDSNHWFFILYDLDIRWITSKNNMAPPLGHIKLCALFSSHRGIQTVVRIQNRAPLLCYFKLFASFHSHQLAVNSSWRYSPETPNLGQNHRFLSRVTLKFYRWPWKTIGYLI